MPWDPSLSYRDCPHCGVRDVAMRLLSTDQLADAANGKHYWATMWCPRCGGVVAVEHTAPNSTSSGGQQVRVIPAGDRVDLDVQHLPTDVAQYYGDALKVLDAGVPDAAAVQLRRTLEAAAAHHGIASGTLVQRIQELISAGKITNEFGAVLDHIRQVGNLGAHATDDRLDEATVRRSLRFTTQVLRNLFEIPHELRGLDPESGSA